MVWLTILSLGFFWGEIKETASLITENALASSPKDIKNPIKSLSHIGRLSWTKNTTGSNETMMSVTIGTDVSTIFRILIISTHGSVEFVMQLIEVMVEKSLHSATQSAAVYSTRNAMQARINRRHQKWSFMRNSVTSTLAFTQHIATHHSPYGIKVSLNNVRNSSGSRS